MELEAALRGSLAAVGDNCIDLYRDLGLTTVGGQAANVAAGWALMGEASEYLGPVATDAAGEAVLAALTGAGVDVHAAMRVVGTTGVTEITLTEDGERVFGRYDPGVAGDYQPADDELGLLAQRSRWVHLANLRSLPAAVAALRATRPYLGVSCDLSDEWASPPGRPDLRGVDVCFFSWPGEPGPQVLAAAELLRASGAALAVGTCGPHGSVALDGRRSIVQPAFPIRVVDTCGAGDAFTARFVVERLAGRDVAVALQAASRAGADACAYQGSFPQPGLVLAS